MSALLRISLYLAVLMFSYLLAIPIDDNTPKNVTVTTNANNNSGVKTTFRFRRIPHVFCYHFVYTHCSTLQGQEKIGIKPLFKAALSGQVAGFQNSLLSFVTIFKITQWN
ncbi:hypothetical protein NQ317_005959 [Molorchus minor]|uniref:Uncharacterized protein n=1 Tax=Molorchus minor TaxID=1323400 RepID=A0ABQ9JJI8_9CUCU|nr:hypothetical protein NQ317_005959 [Molorchus minor]